LTWLYQDHTTRLTARYHHHVSDLSLTGGLQPLLNSRGKIPSALYVDLSYQYVWNEPFGIDGRTTLTAGISNVFSYRPPPIEDSGGFDGFLSGQGHLGRIWNLRIAHQM
jgi:outer membrane receptor protein involved in Fe transport